MPAENCGVCGIASEDTIWKSALNLKHEQENICVHNSYTRRFLTMSKKPSTFVEKHYDWHAAGKVWTFDKVKFVKDPDGDIGISAEELERMHKLIANEVCRSDNNLSPEELEFLCEITATKYVEIAELLRLSKGTVSQWLNKKRSKIAFAESVLLKEFFWTKLFADQLTNDRLIRSMLPSEKLDSMGKAVAEAKLISGKVKLKEVA